MDVQGKVTIITGASMGIGQATARTFAAAGARVVLVARSVDRLAVLADELRGQGHDVLVAPADMRDQDAVYQMVEQAHQYYGRVDILINNAGQAQAGVVATADLEDFRKIIDLN